VVVHKVELDSFDCWLAGFVDGDGCICISYAGDYPFTYVSISQHARERKILEEIRDRYGGTINVCGGIDGFGRGYDRHQMLRLDIRSQGQVTALLRAIEPHLHIKRAKAQAALAALEAQAARSNRWTVHERAYLRANYRRGAAKQIAEHIGRTVGAVHRKAIDLGVRAQ
jgi:hypothetical protein